MDRKSESPAKEQHWPCNQLYVTPAPLPPSVSHSVSSDLCLSAYESLSTLHHLLFSLSLCLSYCSCSISVDLSVSLPLLLSSNSLILFFSPCLSPSLTPFPYLLVSGSLASFPHLQHKQHLGNRSSWAQEVQGGPPGREQRGKSMGTGLQAASVPVFGEVGMTTLSKEKAERAIPGVSGWEMGWGARGGG